MLVGTHRLVPLVVALLWAFVGSAMAEPAPKSAAARIAQQHLGATATVIALDDNRQPLSLGTGFFIDSNGLLATNAHVIQGAAAVVVRWRSRSKEAVRVVRFDERYDLAVLDTGYSRTPAPRLGDSETVVVGQEVVVLGNPQGLEGTVSTGIISGVRELDGIRFIQITAPVSPGSSGGPVFSTEGHVVGITTATVTRGQNLNFALPVNLLRSLPSVALALKSVRPRQTEVEDARQLKDLVQLVNVRPGGQSYGWYKVIFSVKNGTRHPLASATVLLVLRNRATGDVFSYQKRECKFIEPIPPDLAKQETISAQVAGMSMEKEGSFELRILDFRLARGESPVEFIKRE
jgi:S1-C subfamily serine protease